MGNYAEDDPNIMPGIEPLKEALAKAGKSIDLKIYGDGAKHAFNKQHQRRPLAPRSRGRRMAAHGGLLQGQLVGLDGLSIPVGAEGAVRDLSTLHVIRRRPSRSPLLR